MLIGVDANEANLSHRVGVNQYAFDLLHALKKLKTPHTFQIYLKTPPLSDLPEKGDNWDYRIIPFPKMWTQTRLPWDLFTHSPRPDVFFSPSHYAPRLAPMPSVVSIMDLGFLDTPEQFTAYDFNQLKSWTSYSVRQAKEIITISEYTKKDVIKHYGIKADRITVTYPGYDSGLFKPTTNPNVLKKYGIAGKYLLFLSSLKPSKNVEGLVRAFSRIKEPIKLVIAGKKAWLYDEIFTLVNNLGLTEKVIFTGFIEESEVPVLMSSCEAFILPSFHEGFGIPVAEAMACGVPVVVSDVASLPEVAGKAGVYVDPHSVDSIYTGIMTAMGPKRTQMIKTGQDRVKLFNWQKTAECTIQVLKKAATYA